MSTKPKVLVADPISERGIAELSVGGSLEVTVKTGLKEPELLEIIPEFSALVVRSQTKATAKLLEAAKNLRVIGRAGVGVDLPSVEQRPRDGSRSAQPYLVLWLGRQRYLSLMIEAGSKLNWTALELLSPQ